jgi:hypothetical protein
LLGNLIGYKTDKKAHFLNPWQALPYGKPFATDLKKKKRPMSDCSTSAAPTVIFIPHSHPDVFEE